MAAAGEPARRSLHALIALLAAAACTPRAATEVADGGDGAGAGRSATTAPSLTISASDPVAELRSHEANLRRSIDPARPPPRRDVFGADPWALRQAPAKLGRGAAWIGILRGRDALVVLDDALHELSRLATPRAPAGLAVDAASGDVYVTSELSPVLARFVIGKAGTLERRDVVVAPPGGDTRAVHGLRDVTVTTQGTVWALDERNARALDLGHGAIDARAPRAVAVGHGGAQIVATDRHLVTNAVTDHTIVVHPLDARGHAAGSAITLRNDGPFWGFDARETADGLLVAAGAVEDHPLDRGGGFFGFIDSFVYIYRVRDGGPPERLFAENVSERGVVTPKALAFAAAPPPSARSFSVVVTGYGAERGVVIDVVPADERTPRLRGFDFVPGARAVVATSAPARTFAFADPLLDAWVRWDEGQPPAIVPAEDRDARASALRLGEALFFTTRMAPENPTEGAHSRFTCETCHFEGYVDGRTHHTGRGDVRATTKPLVGLLGNRPYFTRALDPDLSTVSHAEFRVAGAGSDHDPFFTLDVARAPWTRQLGVTADVSAIDQRRALMTFLASFSHAPNPAVLGRRAFDDEEARGARTFRDRCERCHSARLLADDATSLVPFAEWERFVFSEEGALVWARSGYEKTGVVPYVHDEGARPSSLRRLDKKHPYFTNGFAKSVGDVLDAAGWVGPSFFHQQRPVDAEVLPPEDKRALEAFLALL